MTFLTRSSHPPHLQQNQERMPLCRSPFLLPQLNGRRWKLRGRRQTGTAPGPDGLSNTELKKIPTSILAHIFNWMIYKTLPEDLKLSRTVFVPKEVEVKSLNDLRPITIASLLVCLFSKILLRRFSTGTAFHPFQNGFQNDCATSNNLLMLQGVMNHAKTNKNPLFCASLDLICQPQVLH